MPERSKEIRERLRGKGLPSGKKQNKKPFKVIPITLSFVVLGW